MIINSINKPLNKPSDFFGKLFQLRDIVHLRHLKPSNPGSLGSGWEHKSLNVLYEEILDITDGLIESYQGKYGLLDITIPESKVTDILPLLQVIVKNCDNGVIYKSFGNDTWIQNQLDELSKLLYQTIYRLTYLR